MIQFNLLPDIKVEYVKAKRRKRLVMVVAVLAAGVSLAFLVVLFTIVQIGQKKHIADLNKDIKSNIKKLQSTPNLDKLLTIQNQLQSLPDLNDEKPVTSRLVTYLPQIVPAQVTVNKLTLDFTSLVFDMEGSADKIATVNKFVDTLKFTKYKVEGSEDSNPAFSEVVLSSFSTNGGGNAQNQATFHVTLKFDLAIFDSKNQVTLDVPKIVTTRSETEAPKLDLFSKPATNQPAGQ